MKPLVIFDIDRTIYNGSLGQDFILHLVNKQIISPAVLTELTLFYIEYETELISYEKTVATILNFLAKELSGQDFEKIRKETEIFIKTQHHKFYDYAFEIPKIYNQFEYVLLSLEPDFLASEVGKMLEIKNTIGNEFTHNHNFKTEFNITTNKIELFEKTQFKNREIFAAFGDSESDFKILSKAQHSFVINPTNHLLQLVKNNISFQEVSPKTAYESFKKLVS